MNLLAERLHLLADLIEAADQAGVPIPTSISATSHKILPAAQLHLEPAAFEAWLAFACRTTMVAVQEYDHDGLHWQRADVTLAGPVQVTLTTATRLPRTDEAVTA